MQKIEIFDLGDSVVWAEGDFIREYISRSIMLDRLSKIFSHTLYDLQIIRHDLSIVRAK